MIRLDQYDNSWYNPGPKWKIALWYAVSIVFFRTTIPYPSQLKVIMLRMFGAKIGRGVIIKPSVIIKYPWKLSIGNHSWIGEQVWIDNLDQVTIGNHCCISQGAMLLCGNHDYTKGTFDLVINSIILDDGVWVGARGLIGPGVHLKKNSVISAATIQTKSTEMNCVYKGNPALLHSDRVMQDS